MATKKPTKKAKAKRAKVTETVLEAAIPQVEEMPGKPGRPTVYTQEIADRICAELATGASLRSVCRSDENMPAESTVRLWAQDLKSPFAAQYVRAREIGYLSMADETVDIADDGSNDWMIRHGKDGEESWAINGEHVQRSRLRVDTRKWLVSKCLPKIFGERVTTEVTGRDGGPIETKEVSDIELARKLAFILGRAVGRGEAAVKSDAAT